MGIIFNYFYNINRISLIVGKDLEELWKRKNIFTDIYFIDILRLNISLVWILDSLIRDLTLRKGRTVNSISLNWKPLRMANGSSYSPVSNRFETNLELFDLMPVQTYPNSDPRLFPICRILRAKLMERMKCRNWIIQMFVRYVAIVKFIAKVAIV